MDKLEQIEATRVKFAGIFIKVSVFETAILALDYCGGLGRANGGEYE